MIEMLVAVAIVGVLAALVMGGVGGVQASARTAATISNLRQLQGANTAYAAENNGWYVATYEGWWGNPWRDNAEFLKYLGREGRNGWSDPSKVTRSGFPAPWAIIASTVCKVPGPNGPQHFWSGATFRLNQTQIERPATTLAFIDANDWWVAPNAWNAWSSAAKNDSTQDNGNAMIAYRNRGKAAGVTFAGNVVLLTPDELDPDSTNGGWRWFYNGRRWE